MSTVDTIADELLEAFLDAFPTVASMIGLPSSKGLLLTDYREDAEDALAAHVNEIAARAAAIPSAELTAQELITREVIREQAYALSARLDARTIEFAICASFNAPAADLLVSIPMFTITSQDRADLYLARLGAIPDALAVLAERHRAGIKAGRLPVRHLVEAAADHFTRYLESDEDPLRRPVPAEGSGVDGDEYLRRLGQVITDHVRPAYATYRDILRDEIAPMSRGTDQPGLSWLPGGDSIYQLLIGINTTTSRTAEELHQTGIDLVAQLAADYREAGGRVFGTGDVAEIFERLRSDPALRWNDAEELLSAARLAIGRAEEAAPAWFGNVPSQSCEVQAVPDDEAPGAPIAYYFPPALDGSRPGIYFANTYHVQERDRFACETTAFHEAVPGHHFQLSLSQALTDLPMLRRIAPFNAYAEGWGLYAERLADEMGLYSSDLARIGMLASDSLRAVRLVVDTGLHAKGWSREQAIRYMSENTPMPSVQVESEIDRYIADPAQALTYMVGRLEIQRIRAEAEAALGDRFDIRAFHDVVLGNGSLPLSALDELVRAWVASQNG